MRKSGGERDRSIDALLRRQREDVADPQATEPCVDAETLAAWMDGALSGETLAAAEHHAAGCARCQAMLASMARTAPEMAARPWWRSLTVRWGVPIAAAATALVLWVSVDRQRNAAVPPLNTSPETSRATEPATPPAMLPDARARSAASVDQEKDAPARSAKAGAPTDTLAQRIVPPGIAPGGAGGGRVIDALRPSLQTRSDNAASAATPAAMTPPPAPPPRAAPNAAPPPATEPVVPTGLAETVTVTSESSARAMMAAGRAGGGSAFAAGVEIVSPEPAFRWRIGVPGTIQRSTDGGVTWKSQPAPATVALTAGSAPARDVCWIVGRAGTVALSTDGTTWQLRPFPEAVNLTAVRAIDAKTATVTTADGRQFSTADGGATWSKTP